MNIIAANQNLTMSSREIAKLTEKEHKHVIRDTRNMLDSLGIEQSPYLDFDNSGANGREVSFFVLPKDLTITLVSGYNVKMRHAITKRWLELENGQRFQIPQTLGEALQLAADQAKALELAAPKVAFVDNLVDRTALMNASQVAQKHKKSAIWLNKILTELKVYNKAVKRGKVFQQWFIDKGYGEMKQSEEGYSQAMFTNAGEVWINEKLHTEGVV